MVLLILTLLGSLGIGLGITDERGFGTGAVAGGGGAPAIQYSLWFMNNSA